MSQTTIAKSQSLVRALQDQLSKRLPSLSISSSMDSQGARLYISQDASTPIAGDQTVLIRIKGENTQFSDVIGLPQNVFSPSIAQVIEEASSIPDVSLMSLANRLVIDMELAKQGMKQERYMNSNGSAPAMSQFAADGSVSGSNLILSFAADQYHPQSGQ
jgi:hypothetical protein